MYVLFVYFPAVESDASHLEDSKLPMKKGTGACLHY